MRAAILTTLTTALALAALPATARAEPGNDELWLGGSVRALHAGSANAVTASDLGGGSLGYARALGVATRPGLALWLDLGMFSGSAKGEMFQTIGTTVSAVAGTAGIRARYNLHRLIAASARLDLGVQRAALSLDDRSGTATSDHGWGTLAAASAALDLFANARGPFCFGVRFEYGYTLAQSLDLTPRRTSASDVLELAMTEASIGSLDLSGPTFTASLVAQF
jgi:hypothetical protein